MKFIRMRCDHTLKAVNSTNTHKMIMLLSKTQYQIKLCFLWLVWFSVPYILSAKEVIT